MMILVMMAVLAVVVAAVALPGGDARQSASEFCRVECIEYQARV
jgi:hypothetical protein